jgi:hypothetical protein
MATGYVPSADGASLSFFSGGEPITHGGGGDPAHGQEGSMMVRETAFLNFMLFLMETDRAKTGSG